MRAFAPSLCALLLLGACSGPAPTQDAPTYHRDVAPLLADKCLGCHNDQGIGTVNLQGYESVQALAPLIVQAVNDRTMPPWPAREENCHPFADSLALTNAQIDVLSAWSQAGTPRGAPMTPPDPKADQNRPTIDLWLSPNEPYTPIVSALDDYRCFVLDPQLNASRDVVGVFIEPGNPRIVHHAVLFEVRPEGLETLEQLDRQSDGEGYPCFGGSGVPVRTAPAPMGSEELASFNQQGLGGWAPGAAFRPLPQGTGLRLAAGSKLVLQLHYHVTPSKRGQADQTRVGLQLSPGPVDSPALWVPLAKLDLFVPRGLSSAEPAATVQTSIASAFETKLFGITPHMHLLGRSIKVELEHQDQSRECLIDVPQWDFHWQRTYWYERPIEIKAGAGRFDRYRLSCTYDTTDAERDVRWGQNSTDEMCVSFVYLAR